ncbi:hypothetical protein Tco_0013919 [Tanacetum coccineum]
MAEENVSAPALIRSDEQILPFKAWLLVGMGNLLLDLQKLQKNPIFRISVDILHNTNFFRAFTASANVPTIYIQHALGITPKDPAHSFLAGEQVMDFVNELGYPKEIHFVSKMHVNNLYHPWRAIMSLINQSNVYYDELLWEEFVQGIQTFFSHRANLNIPTKKSTPHVIPYCRFTKLIIFHLGNEHNIHRRPESAIHVTGDDFPLGNLKFVPKGEKDEVFGNLIPKEFITEAIQTSPYYQQYLEMVARKPIAKRDEQKKTVSEADKPKKPTPVKKPAPAKQTKPLVDEDEEVQHEPEPQVENEEYDIQRGITRSLPTVEAKGKGIAIDEQRRTPATEEASVGPSAQPEDDTSTNIVRDTPSPPDAETDVEAEISDSEGDTKILNVGEEICEDISNIVALEERTVKLNEGQAGLDPGKANVEFEVESMVTVPIHQASLSAPPLSTPIIDIITSKPVSPPLQEPVFTATTLLLPPPPPQ